MTAAAGGHPSDPVVPRSARIFRRLIVLAAVVGGAVLAMAWNDRSAVNSETRGASQIARSDEVLEGSYSLERRLVDLETGLRGFEATDDRLFLQPWDAARSLIPIELTHLQGIAETAAQRNRVRELGAAIAAYIANYAAPITRERAAPRGTALVGSFARGKRLFDALRRRFDEIDDAELALRASRGRHARSIAATVNITTLVAAGVVMIAVAALLLYVFRAVIIPLRRLIAACARLSGGDRGIRLPAPNS
jgi:CHASE3 domain sensor protein